MDPEKLKQLCKILQSSHTQRINSKTTLDEQKKQTGVQISTVRSFSQRKVKQPPVTLDALRGLSQDDQPSVHYGVSDYSKTKKYSDFTKPTTPFSMQTIKTPQTRPRSNLLSDRHRSSHSHEIIT